MSIECLQNSEIIVFRKLVVNFQLSCNYCMRMSQQIISAHYNTNISCLQHYGIKITDRNQPLLLSKPKKKDIRRGQKGNIYLLPELCLLTGIVST